MPTHIAFLYFHNWLYLREIVIPRFSVKHNGDFRCIVLYYYFDEKGYLNHALIIKMFKKVTF